MKRIRIALVGDFDEKISTLVRLNQSIAHCRHQVPFELNANWVSTDSVKKILRMPREHDGIWIVPGSPYKNDAGVYQVIQMARENDVPIMGSCGGFQYMILEYATNVLKIKDAGHEEINSKAVPVISKLSCSLKGQEELVLIPDKRSWLYKVLGMESITGKYYCSYGLNPAFQERLSLSPFVFTAFSPTGEVRAFELMTHRFFKGTLFQPSLDSSLENPNPLITSFFGACS
ncbi:MAG TPA: hypothetical protein VE467_10145 [Chryseolinea sp.]|nr:hypothetical protein [Chryseolinea sp.]